MSQPDTIVAISTPPGTGGIGIVRLSGPQALQISQTLFSAKQSLADRPRFMILGRVLDAAGRPIDKGMACFFKGPDSYTGEDMVEFSCHGSSVVLDLLVRAALAQGASLASAGEFTRRAFTNGKMDLVQAEAVVDLIHAGSRAGLDNAYGQNSGQLSRLFQELKSYIVKSLSLLEIGFDFVEEDTEYIPRAEIRQWLVQARDLSFRLIDTFEGCRRRLEGGPQIALIGRPNVGKSTLLNALLDEEKAIVTSIPGTTRDIIEGQVVWQGEALRLIDTAGIRAGGADPIEEEGIRRTLQKVKEADILLGVLDNAAPFSTEDQAILDQLDQGQASLIVRNKIDLPQQLDPVTLGTRCSIEVSAKSATGLRELKENILALLPKPSLVQGIGITRQRHFDGLSKINKKVDLAIQMLDEGLLEECIAAELYDCIQQLGSILGENLDNVVLDMVFAEFCIGK